MRGVPDAGRAAQGGAQPGRARHRRLVVIGGDGSLTGADLFRQEWPGLLAELAAAGEIDRDDVADRTPR